MIFPRQGFLATSTCTQFVSGMCVSSTTTYVLAATTLPDFLVTGFYFVLTWWLLGGTAGQRLLLGLRVVDQTTGGQISFRQSVGRFFGYLLSIWLLCLGLIWVGSDTYKQGWHDKLAHTDVIRRYRT
jgi:uncharacterized RDD family membrane protein YckC